MDFDQTFKAWKKEQDAYVALALALKAAIDLPVDVDEWWDKSQEIGQLCQKFVGHVAGTIFLQSDEEHFAEYVWRSAFV